MRRLAAALCVVVLACASDAQDESEMSPDSAAMAPPPAAPAGITLADVRGRWNMEVRPLDRDTVVSTYLLDTSSDTAWTLTFPGRQPIPVHVTGVAGDSIMTHVPTFSSSVRAGDVQTEVTGAYRLQNGELVGIVVAHYKVTTPDSVTSYRTRGTRAQ